MVLKWQVKPHLLNIETMWCFAKISVGYVPGIVLGVTVTKGNKHITVSLHFPCWKAYFIRPLQHKISLSYPTPHANRINFLKDCIYYACLNSNKSQCFYRNNCFMWNCYAILYCKESPLTREVSDLHLTCWEVISGQLECLSWYKFLCLLKALHAGQPINKFYNRGFE